MSQNKETIKIKCSYGFHYDVTIEYYPNHGFANALYEDDIIDQCNLNKIQVPIGDDDGEWERYEEMFGEWKDEMKTNLEPKCKQYFDNL